MESVGTFASHGVARVAELGKHGMDKVAEAFTAIFQSQVNVVASSTMCDATKPGLQGTGRRYRSETFREIVDYSKTDLATQK